MKSKIILAVVSTGLSLISFIHFSCKNQFAATSKSNATQAENSVAVAQSTSPLPADSFSFFEGFNDTEEGIGKAGTPGRWNAGVLCKEWSLQLVGSPKTEGAKAARFELRKTDSCPKADLAHPNRIENGNIPHNQDLWFGMAIMLPSGFDIISKRPEILFQLHPKNQATPACGGKPSVTIDVNEGRYAVYVRHGDPCSNDGKWVDKYDGGPVVRDRYVKFVVNAMLANNVAGYVKVWINDGEGDDTKPVVTHNGAVAYDFEGSYVRVGLYAPDCNKGCKQYNWESFVVYFDEYRQGRSYKEVVPKGDE